MAMVRIERHTFEYAPAGSGTTNLKHLEALDSILACTCRVVRAANGTGTVSIGFGGTANGLMTTGDVGAGVTGRKLGSVGTLLVTNANGYTPGTGYITATYTIGTDTITPIIRITVLTVRQSTWDKIMVR